MSACVLRIYIFSSAIIGENAASAERANTICEVTWWANNVDGVGRYGRYRSAGKIVQTDRQTDSPLATPGPRTKGWKNEGRKVNKKSQWTLNYASGSPPGDMDWPSFGDSPPQRFDRRLLPRISWGVISASVFDLWERLEPVAIHIYGWHPCISPWICITGLHISPRTALQWIHDARFLFLIHLFTSSINVFVATEQVYIIKLKF